MDRSDDLIDTSAAAKLLGVAPLVVLEWAKQGRILRFQGALGSRYWFRRGDILAYLDADRAAKQGRGDEAPADAEPKTSAG